MSILLDALKKSEAQRRLGEVPTLQTQVPLDDGRTGGRHGWIPLALILVSAGIMAWTGISQFRHDGSVPINAEEASALPPPQTEVVASDPEERMGSAKNTRTRLAANRVASGRAASTPVQDYAAPEAPSDPVPRQQESGRSDAVSAASRRVTHVEIPENAPARASTAGLPATDAGSNEPVGASIVTGQGEYAPQTISYWQIPQSLREELGEFRISVLVYAENPADRFLLVNGSRLREQEKAENGAVLEEIQRDRAVFSYRNYRFHVRN